jgi:uncharacterized protein
MASLVALLLVLALAGPASALTVPERPANYVVDMAGVVRADIAGPLNLYLKELDEKTGAQVVVLTVPSLEGEALEAFSLSVAEKWKLGSKDKDNGLLFFVAIGDRKYRFEVGYGLEGILPDSAVGSIGRELVVPRFRAGDYSGGIEAAVGAIVETIARDEGVTLTGRPEGLGAAGGVGGGGVLQVIGTIAILLVMGYLFIRHPYLFILLMMSGGGRSSWGGGRGFGGGGGGFGGGGGGGFGGGGASGGW